VLKMVVLSQPLLTPVFIWVLKVVGLGIKNGCTK
jgi:hypothetical protein